MGDINANAGSRQNLAYARHDVTTIFSDLTRALSNHPNSRDAHRIRRERDEAFLLSQRPQAKNRQRAFASSSVKEDQQRQCTGFVAPRKVVGSLSAGTGRRLHGARLARPAGFLGGYMA